MTRAPLLLVACLAVAATATAARLDDSASPRQRFDLSPRWVHEHDTGGSPDRLNAMVAEMANVEVRLNTTAYVGKRGRIYLVLPPVVAGLRSASGMRVEWRTRGTLLDGAALPGDRTLLYDGPISRPSINEIFDFVIHLDARHMAGGLRFDPTFEIDLAP